MSDEGRGRRRSIHRLAKVAALLGAIVVLVCGCSQESPRPRPEPKPPPGSRQLTIWLTGYSWQDNTPPGSSIVGEPVLHKQAGGQGTFVDPLTVAVPGHQGNMEWQPGTKFYLPTVQRYVIVEDSGAAEAPAGTDTHLDMWIDGQDGTKQSTDQCENRLTGRVPAQLNPPDKLPVMLGPIYANQMCNIPAQPEDMGSYTDGSGSGDEGDSGQRSHLHSDQGDNDDGGDGGGNN